MMDQMIHKYNTETIVEIYKTLAGKEDSDKVNVLDGNIQCQNTEIAAQIMGLTDYLEGRRTTTPLYFLGDYVNGRVDTDRIVDAVEYKEDYNSHNELGLGDGTQVLDLDKIMGNQEEIAEKLRVKDNYNYGIGQRLGAWYLALAKDPNFSLNQ